MEKTCPHCGKIYKRSGVYFENHVKGCQEKDTGKDLCPYCRKGEWVTQDNGSVSFGKCRSCGNYDIKAEKDKESNRYDYKRWEEGRW